MFIHWRVAGLLLFLCHVAVIGAGREDGWLNARDFGASGSRFSTPTATTAASRTITVTEVGDFREGQGVMVSKCNPRIVLEQLWGPRGKVAWGRKLDGQAELRGYDGTQGDWLVLILDVGRGATGFRWSEDLGRTWASTVPITGEWQPLRDGMEVRFNEFEWEQGYTVVFGCRCQLVTAIEAISEKTFTLRDAPTRSAPDAMLRHCDDAALQEAIDQALKEHRNLCIPNGHYRLSKGLQLRNPDGITIEGQNAVQTILDIGEGNGACLRIIQGQQATVRNLTMVGHSGFERRDQCGHIPMQGSSYFWGFAAKNCNATTVSGTERVLIENCHGKRMASECFVSSCRGRGATRPNQCYTKSLTYLRCSATDCGRNAFNDVTCGPENTQVLHCRIVDVGGCAWEGASRFVTFMGNYVRNAGTVAMGNLGTYNRDASFPAIGAGQHMVCNNVFEGTVPYGRCAIRSAVGSTQVIISGNVFVNFGSSAVEASGRSDPTHYASATTTITGNQFDMTEIGEASRPRTAVAVSASHAVVSDNQVFVRGECDPNVTAIRLSEPAVNLTVHGNLIRNCGWGITTGRAVGRVGKVIDSKTFSPSVTGVPLDARLDRQCEGWSLAWLSGGRPSAVSVLDAVLGAAKPETVRFVLREPRTLDAGSSFETICPAANWSIHGNTVTGCLRPVTLERYGSRTSVFRQNLISRGAATGIGAAIAVQGDYRLIGNHVFGFDEDGTVGLALAADPPGHVLQPCIQDNTFERCSRVIDGDGEAIWASAIKGGNVFIDCENAPEAGGEAFVTAADKATITPPERPVFRAASSARTVAVDGDTAEWPWRQEGRPITLEHSPSGVPVVSPKGRGCAAFDKTYLYLAFAFDLPKGTELQPLEGFGEGDGVEVSLRNADPEHGSPIYVLWGSAGGEHSSSTAMGASADQAQALANAVTYAAKATPTGWSCEWRLPLAELGFEPGHAGVLQFNVGLHCAATKAWVAWVPNGRLCDVAHGGTLRVGP